MNYDKINIVDLEATCWKNSKFDENGNPSEIIEIGICQFYIPSGEIRNMKSIMVRPKNTKVSEFCTDLTGHTWEDVRRGVPLKDACQILKNQFGTKSRIWASWGLSDQIKFRKECEDKGIEYPFSDEHINLVTIFSFLNPTNPEKFKKYGLGKALRVLQKEFVGVPHKGVDDAFNAAIVLKEIYLNAKGVHNE